MVAGGESQRDSERDYEPQASTVSDYDYDGEDDDDPGGIQLARQLSKGSKAVIDKTWSNHCRPCRDRLCRRRCCRRDSLSRCLACFTM